jgi:hypothetical protein
MGGKKAPWLGGSWAGPLAAVLLLLVIALAVAPHRPEASARSWIFLLSAVMLRLLLGKRW